MSLAAIFLCIVSMTSNQNGKYETESKSIPNLRDLKGT